MVVTKQVGAARKRVEDPRLLRGEGAYVDDLREPGCLHAVFVRSPYPHARIRAIERAASLAVPGVIGVLQATEAVKLILGVGKPLIGRLLQYDALGGKFREFKLPRDPKCVTCSVPDKKIELIDYEAFCAIA